jgi:CheY-like chemotaxis protein
MKKVLVLDDDESILEVIKLVLEQKGYNVDTSSSVRNILDKIKKYSPDLILMDNSMPSFDAGKFMRLIRKEKEMKDIPVILVSATNGLEKKAKKLKTNDFIEKPFDMKYFLSVIAKHI